MANTQNSPSQADAQMPISTSSLEHDFQTHAAQSADGANGQGMSSCSECRRRKLKCIKDLEADESCANCRKRGVTCTPQQYKRRASRRVNSSQRFAQLEQRIEALTAALARSATINGELDGHGAGPSSSESDEHGHLTDLPTEDISPPAHLQLLFDNSVIGSEEFRARMPRMSDMQCAQSFLERTRDRLKNLLPSRSDVALISQWAVPMLELYHRISTPATVISDGQDLAMQYDDLNNEPSPTDIAVLLLHLVFAIQQVPSSCRPTLNGWSSVDTWMQAVGTAIEATIISHNVIAATLEGMEVTIMYIHLRLGCGTMGKLWLTLRRTIALAEVIGLPRAANAARRATKRNNGQQMHDERVIQLWENFCVTERMCATMCNFPSATALYRHPLNELAPNGEVNPQRYLLRLSEIATQIQDLDECYAGGETSSDMYPQVIKTDTDLRQLGRQAPPDWWEYDAKTLDVRHLLQAWHYYFLTRIHLIAAMTAHDKHDQFAYSRISCSEACSNLAARYVALRGLLPAGFYLARALDVQIVTATMVLLLTCFDTRDGSDIQPRMALVEEVLKTIDCVAGQPGTDFAGKAASTIRSVQVLLKDPASDTGLHGLTLRVPLLGQVSISKKAGPSLAPQQASMTESGAVDGNAFMPVTDWGPEQDLSAWLMEVDTTSFLQQPVMVAEWDDWANFLDTGF